jgi:type II secretory pathway pseudopilin PulG
VIQPRSLRLAGLRRAQSSREPTRCGSPSRTAAFTAIELLVAIFVLVVLASILIPYLTMLREADRRTRCEANLQQLRDALHHYAAANKFQYPRVVYDAAKRPNSYTCFTGPDASNPFSAGSAVKANDVTASLWLLVRDGLVRDTSVFVCPSSDGSQDPLTDASGRFVKPDQRGNFRRAGYLSYGYSSPFSNAPRYRMDDTREGDFVVLADKGPGFGQPGRIVGPPENAPPLQLAALNSPNHEHAGQNVLYADGSIRWESTAYCGVGHDNIYTALTPKPLNGQTPPADGIGYWGPNIGPAWESDSYLVPETGEGLP